jgi:enolase
MVVIKSINAREILDSRGNPTVEVDVTTDSGFGRAAVPSGASTGVHEALELRDKDKRYGGKGVQTAVRNVNDVIAHKLKGMDPTNQEEIDSTMIELDGTDNKSKLGANAILGVSLAVARASANSLNKPLYAYLAEKGSYVIPVPCMNIINGGEHAGNDLDIQEHMLFPIGFDSFSEALRAGAEVYHILKKILKEKYGPNAINVGDEGGFAPPLKSVREPMELVLNAIDEAGYEGKIKLGLDCAASEFYKDGKYVVEGKDYDSSSLLDLYKDLATTFQIVSIEDPFDEEDFDAFAEMTSEVGDKVQIVGDDLLVTNVSRVKTALEKKACNALLLKVNQIGSLTEARSAHDLVKENGWSVMVSHRSGETTDTFISDLVVALGTGQIKTGASCRGERTAKYNQLLRIEEELGSKGKYAGEKWRA